MASETARYLYYYYSDTKSFDLGSDMSQSKWVCTKSCINQSFIVDSFLIEKMRDIERYWLRTSTKAMFYLLWALNVYLLWFIYLSLNVKILFVIEYISSLVSWKIFAIELLLFLMV